MRICASPPSQTAHEFEIKLVSTIDKQATENVVFIASILQAVHLLADFLRA